MRTPPAFELFADPEGQPPGMLRSVCATALRAWSLSESARLFDRGDYSRVVDALLDAEGLIKLAAPSWLPELRRLRHYVQIVESRRVAA